MRAHIISLGACAFSMAAHDALPPMSPVSTFCGKGWRILQSIAGHNAACHAHFHHESVSFVAHLRLCCAG